MEDKRHPAGSHCWLDLATSDLAAAKEFYTQVLSFGYLEVPMPGGAPGVYTMLAVGDGQQGGARELGPEEKQAKVPPHWMVYTAVDDVDATAAKAVELGGRVMVPAFDIPDTGRMAVLEGPNGEAFAVWDRNSPHPGSSVTDRNQTGAFCWAELAAREPDTSGPFYAGLFGWEPKDGAFPGHPYTVFHNGEQQAAGMFLMPSEMGGAPTAWLIYFMVPDTPAAVARTEELGGRALSPVMQIPGVGTVCTLMDPQGAVFGIVGP